MTEQKYVVTKEQKFVESVIERIKTKMNKEGYCIKYHEKVDNNVIKHGIEIFKETKESDFQIGAIVYLKRFWLEITDDVILQELLDAVNQKPDFNIPKLMDREYILKNVYPMIQKIENLESLRESGYYYSIHDCFLILYYVPIENQDSIFCAHTKIQKHLLNTFNIEEKELKEAAFKNMKESLCIQSMQEFIEDMFGSEIAPDVEPLLIIISNREKYFGASAILLPEVYEQLSKRLGEKFIILPSSIHECLATKYQEDLEMLVNMVREVNESQVEPEEQLSNHIYLCTKEGVSLLK